MIVLPRPTLFDRLPRGAKDVADLAVGRARAADAGDRDLPCSAKLLLDLAEIPKGFGVFPGDPSAQRADHPLRAAAEVRGLTVTPSPMQGRLASRMTLGGHVLVYSAQVRLARPASSTSRQVMHKALIHRRNSSRGRNRRQQGHSKCVDRRASRIALICARNTCRSAARSWEVFLLAGRRVEDIGGRTLLQRFVPMAAEHGAQSWLRHEITHE
jgi:hypothetical protein